MQGWRISMEDSHTNVLDLATGASLDPKTHPTPLAFFGVFDGHGGDKVAYFTGENIHNILLKQDSFLSADYTQGLKDCFLATDRAILNGMLPHPPKLVLSAAIIGHCGALSLDTGLRGQYHLGCYKSLTTDLAIFRSQIRGRGFWVHCVCQSDRGKQGLRCKCHDG